METFYKNLERYSDFDSMAESGAYVPVPEDWFVGVSDIVGSTAEIEAGRYKTVNTVGAAVISAQINSFEGYDFPYVFGGDGAAFALPLIHLEKAEAALAAVRRWALDEFGIELRTATVPVQDIMDAGMEVDVARFQLNVGIDYAMFSGGGLAWAENQMKAGRYSVPIAEEGVLPDLTGLSCRWTPIDPGDNKILCILIQPNQDAPPKRVSKVMHKVLDITAKLDRAGHPVAPQGPGFKWPPSGLALEAHATHGSGALWLRKLQLLFETFIALIFFRFKLSVGGFDAMHYTKTSGQNADFRKFDDGLKMTLSCDRASEEKLRKLLDRAATDGLVHYGMVEQNAALMTCIVPSVMRDDHIHFIDGADGGYALAAKQIKQATSQPRITT